MYDTNTTLKSLQWIDLVNPHDDFSDLEVTGFSHFENDGGQFGRWSVGTLSSIQFNSPQFNSSLFNSSGERNAYVRIKAYIPRPDRQKITIRWQEKVVFEQACSHGERTINELSTTIDLGRFGGSGQTLEILVSESNRSLGFASKDARDLGIRFTCLRVVDGSPSVKRICPYPFTKIELGRDSFVPCCETWLTDSYHAIKDKGVEESLWNGSKAQALRTSILDGSYRFCRRDRCGVYLWERDELDGLKGEFGLKTEVPMGKENLLALLNGIVEMPEGPTSVTYAVDPRCNLACPSCRSEKITKLDDHQIELVSQSHEVLDELSGSLLTLKLAGDGEVFFSKSMRELLKEAPKKFKNLKSIRILSNGILCDERAWEALKPGSDLIRSVTVSIDAGDEQTYARVRGGDWDRLLKNLFWLGSLRRQKRLDEFVLTYVYRLDNLESMKSAAHLAREVGADRISFGPFAPWTRMAVKDYDRQNLLNKENPAHSRFAKIADELRKLPWSSVTP